MAKSIEETVQIKLNQELLEEAQELFEELGLDIDSAVQLFFKQSLNVGGLPFKLRRSRNSRTVREQNGEQSRRAQRREKKQAEEQEQKKTPVIEASDAIINDL